MDKKTAYLFNKLEQLRKSPFTNSLEVLNKRAKAKYSQEPLLNALIELNSPLKHQYINAMDCSSILNAQGDKLTSRYCGNRFCKVCNRIRTGKLINGYADQLLSLKDPQFLTLTIPNVTALNLRDTVKNMGKTMRKIQDNRRKNDLPLIKGVRKLECTYNTNLNNYHPHYHLIIESETIANEVINEWLLYYPEANIKAQKTVTATNCAELFKYFTKLTSNTGKKYINGTRARDEWHYPEAIDVIFTSIVNLRIIQPMGGLKMVSDEIEELQTDVIDGETLEIKEQHIYIWSGENWFSPITGELLSSFRPKIHLRKFREKIRYLQKEHDE